MTAELRGAVLRTEMRDYRDALERLTAAWQFDPALAKIADVDTHLQIYEAIRAAGHAAVLSQLVAERDGTRRSDVFDRFWWICIAPLLTGLQARPSSSCRLSSVRHPDTGSTDQQWCEAGDRMRT